MVLIPTSIPSRDEKNHQKAVEIDMDFNKTRFPMRKFSTPREGILY
jgi:hypothetical protein